MAKPPLFALISGYLAAFLFTFQYIPQTILNFKRKSISGLSTTGIIVKLIGASFLTVNSYLIEEALPTILYGFLNVLQMFIFMYQFAAYTGKRHYYFWMLFPIIPIVIGEFYPASIYYTNSIKPISQIFSHIPQLIVSYEKKSTYGFSLLGQHLNFIGGVLGIYMFIMIPPVSKYTVLVYCFSLLQATSMYLFAAYYDGVNRFFDESETASASKIAAVLGSAELPLTFSVSNIITSTQPPSQKHPKKADKGNYDDDDDDDDVVVPNDKENNRASNSAGAISMTSNSNMTTLSVSSNQ